jgi:hypothetical protein
MEKKSPRVPSLASNARLLVDIGAGTASETTQALTLAQVVSKTENCERIP